jgi:uncharacterized protein
MAAAMLATPSVALADVKAGVDAWSAGDYASAVREWREPAAKGDPDALFNMAQAYRLGRGVEQNAKQAEVFYAKAAAKGHLKAADNLGRLMFQGGRREEAMPYVTAAADRGDPRAQYLLGIAHFNGDLVEKDWVRAYALMTLANAASLPQAGPAIRQMDDYISLEQRQKAQPLAATIKAEADARRASQFAAADLGAGAPAPTIVEPPSRPATPVRSAARMPPPPAARIPQPIPETTVGPSIAAAQAAISEATRVTGTQSPADAGASFAARTITPEVATTPVRPKPSPATQPSPAPASGASAPVVAVEPAVRAAGPWKVQLGAFSVPANAETLWSLLAQRSELAGASKLLVPAGRLTKLQAGGFASRKAAQDACNALKQGGQDCLVTR